MNDCIAVNIQDMLKAIGEEELSRVLSDFSCPLNAEVEDFVRNKALDFAKRKLSITYLVMKKMNEEKNVLVGIYTLSHKAIEITNANISNTTRKKLLRYAALDKDTDKYNQSNIFSPIRDAGTIPKHRQCGNGLLTSVFHWRMTF